MVRKVLFLTKMKAACEPNMKPKSEVNSNLASFNEFETLLQRNEFALNIRRCS